MRKQRGAYRAIYAIDKYHLIFSRSLDMMMVSHSKYNEETKRRRGLMMISSPLCDRGVYIF